MTLAEVQAIGCEVGIDPRLVAHAATALDKGGHSTSRSFLGLPIGVGGTIELGRKLSDDEWDRLVVDLRETFEARGTIRQEGSFRARLRRQQMEEIAGRLTLAAESKPALDRDS